MLTVAQHHDLLNAQFAVNCKEIPNHPCNWIFNEPDDPRNMKRKLPGATAARRRKIPLSARQRKQQLAAIHQAVVAESKRNAAPNRVLRSRPPNIHESEISLPRAARRRLAQLRSGHSSVLGSYKHFIDDQHDDTCPLCDAAPEDVLHLFRCRATPTTCGPTSLWTAPRQVLQDLGHRLELGDSLDG